MGRDKATLTLGGETLLRRTSRILAEVAGEVLVVGRTEAPGLPAVRALPDGPEGSGPLAGLLTGLRAITAPFALVVACDLPFLDPALLRHLLALAPGCDAVIPSAGGHRQTAHAVYAQSVHHAAAALLASGEYRFERLLSALSIRWVDEVEIAAAGFSLRSFTNVNTPEEWQDVQGAFSAS